jgi:hypothetical protein
VSAAPPRGAAPAGPRAAGWGAGAADALYLPAASPSMYAHVPSVEQLAGAAEGARVAGLVLLEPSRDHRHPLLRLRVAVDDIREVYAKTADPLAERVLTG